LIFLIKKGDIINSIVGWRGHFIAMGKLWESLPQDLWQNSIAVPSAGVSLAIGYTCR